MFLHHYSKIDFIWLSVGFAGQALFGMRFLIQWIMSEYKKMSVIPDIFWYFSLFGGITLFIYALHKHDPVFIFGQGLGILIYLRNIILIRNQPNANSLSNNDSGSTKA